MVFFKKNEIEGKVLHPLKQLDDSIQLKQDVMLILDGKCNACFMNYDDIFFCYECRYALCPECAKNNVDKITIRFKNLKVKCKLCTKKLDYLKDPYDNVSTTCQSAEYGGCGKFLAGAYVFHCSNQACLESGGFDYCTECAMINKSDSWL